MLKVCTMEDTQLAFGRLANTTSVSWNSLITGYTKCGKLHDALALYKTLSKDETVYISAHTFVALLRACIKLQDSNGGVELHADISKRGTLKADLFVGNTLVCMYTKCGLLSKAQQLFDELSTRDVVSWTTLIAAYADNGHGEEAVRCFDRMRLEGVFPNNVTVVCSLKACSALGETRKGQEMHVEIERNGLLEREAAVGNALVNMYCKCGLIEDAEQVFNMLPIRDVISWTALIAGYAEHKYPMKALKYFEEMKAAAVSPNTHTFASSLKACGMIGAIDKVDEIYTEISRNGLLERDLVLGNTLVNIYAKCDSLENAEHIFNELLVRNVVTWTSLISGYTDHRHDEQSIKCFEQMLLEGILPDALTYVCILKCCGTLGALITGHRIHIGIERKGGLHKDVFVGNALVDMYMKCGCLAKAQEVFDNLPIREVVVWTTFIVGCLDQGKGAEALRCFDNMQLEGVLSSVLTLIYSLKACANRHAIGKGEEIHAEIVKRALRQEDLDIGNNLVEMYVKCGLFMEALDVFDGLPARNYVSWNALISGYVDHGSSEDGLMCFELMQLEGVLQNIVSFVWSLKASGNIGSIDKGYEIHTEIAKKGLMEADITIGNAVVGMYANCGSVQEAHRALDSIPGRDIVSWNGLITGYVEYGHDEAAIRCLELMQLDGIPPNGITYVSLLKACANIGDINKGQEMHSDIDKIGPLVRVPVVQNALIHMYARLGFLGKAEEIAVDVFDEHVISRTTIIEGYVEQGRFEQALSCFEQMQCEGISPTPITFIFVLKACGNAEAVVRGKAIHCQIGSASEFEVDFPVVGNMLLDMYAKCNLLDEAQKLFDELRARDTCSWTSLIAGYVGHGSGEKALECFELMRLEGVSADAFTWVSVMRACGIVGALNRGQDIHMTMERMGLLNTDVIASNAVLGMYVDCGLLAVAQEIFDKHLLHRGVVSWNVLITGYAEQGQGERALQCISQMQLEGGFPDAVTYLGSLKACGNIKSPAKCCEMHAVLDQRGILTTNTLIWNALIDAYSECGMLSEVEELFLKLPIRNVVSWTALIAGYLKLGHGAEALQCIERMRLERICPNLVTFICSLRACSSLGAAGKGQELHMEMEKKGLVSERGLCAVVAGNNTLIDMYAKCGFLEEACEVLFDLEMARIGTVVSWNAVLAGYAQLGECSKVFRLFHRIIGEGLKPSDATFLIVLSACSRAGFLYNSCMYFDAMTEIYGIAPTIKHVSGMVDLLCRIGDMHNAIQMAKEIPVRADLAAWHSILGVCRDHGNVALAEDAFASAMKMNRNDASSCVFMAQISMQALMQAR